MHALSFVLSYLALEANVLKAFLLSFGLAAVLLGLGAGLRLGLEALLLLIGGLFGVEGGHCREGGWWWIKGWREESWP